MDRFAPSPVAVTIVVVIAVLVVALKWHRRGYSNRPGIRDRPVDDHT